MSARLAADDAAQLIIDEELIRRFNKSGPRYTSYPSADRFQPSFGAADYHQALARRAALLEAGQAAPLSLYVHIPFCASLCYYCACNKVITKNKGQGGEYIRYLQRELQLASQHMPARQTLRQLHFGGGTPTFLNNAELTQLMEILRDGFVFEEEAELGIEIDPRTVSHNSMAQLAALGFNRTSFGVQDFDAAVQQAVHRIQPYAMVQEAMQAARENGFSSINVDLIYGLPKQNLASFDATISQVLELMPDRIALYNYAHLPQRFKPQRRILEADLPSAEERLQIFLLSLRRLTEAGYVYIGLDHFAKPDDSLSQALRDHRLHRNFQGYTTSAECDLLALGTSSIGLIGDAYVQAQRELPQYYAMLDAGVLPVEKGFHLSRDEKLRRSVIQHIMCARPLDFAAFGQAWQIDFADYFAPELARMQTYQELDLIQLDAQGLRITARGRMFVRAVAMEFDAFLHQATQATYSRLI